MALTNVRNLISGGNMQSALTFNGQFIVPHYMGQVDSFSEDKNNSKKTFLPNTATENDVYYVREKERRYIYKGGVWTDNLSTLNGWYKTGITDSINSENAVFSDKSLLAVGNRNTSYNWLGYTLYDFDYTHKYYISGWTKCTGLTSGNGWDSLVYIGGYEYSQGNYSVSNVSGTSFGYASDGKHYVSENVGIAGSVAICKVEFDLPYEATVNFYVVNNQYWSSSYGILGQVDKSVSLEHVSNHTYESNVYWDGYNNKLASERKIKYTIPAGKHYVMVKYSSRDKYVAEGNDEFKFRVEVEAGQEVKNRSIYPHGNSKMTTTNKWMFASTLLDSLKESDTRLMITYARFLNAGTANTDKILTDGWLVVDLTESFGVGKEPNKAWCDQHLSYFNGSVQIDKDIKNDYTIINNTQNPLFVIPSSGTDAYYNHDTNANATVVHSGGSSVTHNAYLKLTGNTTSSVITVDSKYKIPFIRGHKYFIATDVMSPTRTTASTENSYDLVAPMAYTDSNQVKNLRLLNDGSSGSKCVLERKYPKLENPNEWYRAGVIAQTTDLSDSTYFLRFKNNNNKTNREICFTNVIYVDLTATFGEGKEKNLAWCMENIVLDGSGIAKIKNANYVDDHGVNGVNYINFVMKHRSKKLHTKIEYMDKNEKVLGEIKGFTTGGQIDISNSDMIRRTLSLDFVANDKLDMLALKNGALTPNTDSPLWANKRLRISTGIEDYKGNIYWFNQGIFVPTAPDTKVSLSGRTISLKASDKMILADSCVESVIKLTTSNLISTAVKNLVAKVDTSGKFLINNSDYYMPYEYTTNYGDKIVDIIKEVTNLYMDYECYYNLDGYFVFDKMQNKINNIPIWSFKDEYDFTVSRNITSDYRNIYNQFYIWGYTNDSGVQAKYSGSLPDSHPFSAKNIGVHTLTLQDDKWYTNDQCKAQFDYYKQQSSNLINTFSISCAPVYNLNDVNKVINVYDKYMEHPYICLVDSISYPLSPSGLMSINCHQIFDTSKE